MIVPLLVALVAQGPLSGPTPSNALTSAERAAGWRLLFDGRTLRGWRGLGYDSVPTAHWVVVEGAVKEIARGNVAEPPGGQPQSGGELMNLQKVRDLRPTLGGEVPPRADTRRQY